jgi:predicted nucleotidyltransferase
LGTPPSLVQYVGLQEYIAKLFEIPVEVVDRDGLRPHLRAPMERGAIYAF